MKITFFKTARHRTFNHTPIYYDEAKEEREERARRIKDELGIEQEEDTRTIEDRVRGKMRRKIKTNYDVVRKEKRKSNLRIILIIIGLMILFYYLLDSSKEWIFNYM
jgi:flagellar motility protein MotE (MotC chaperone)